jgi:chemotaxis signal transduction protein
MRAGRLGVTRPVIETRHSVILFRVGPYRMGIDAGALKEIRHDDAQAARPPGCETVVSAHALFGVPAGPEGRLLVLRDGGVGVHVDRVERMIETRELRPLPQAFHGDERSWYCGLVLVGDSVCPVVNPETLARLAEPSDEKAGPSAGAIPVIPCEAAAL